MAIKVTIPKIIIETKTGEFKVLFLDSYLPILSITLLNRNAVDKTAGTTVEKSMEALMKYSKNET